MTLPHRLNNINVALIRKVTPMLSSPDALRQDAFVAVLFQSSFRRVFGLNDLMSLGRLWVSLTLSVILQVGLQVGSMAFRSSRVMIFVLINSMPLVVCSPKIRLKTPPPYLNVLGSELDAEDKSEQADYTGQATSSNYFGPHNLYPSVLCPSIRTLSPSVLSVTTLAPSLLDDDELRLREVEIAYLGNVNTTRTLIPVNVSIVAPVLRLPPPRRIFTPLIPAPHHTVVPFLLLPPPRRVPPPLIPVHVSIVAPVLTPPRRATTPLEGVINSNSPLTDYAIEKFIQGIIQIISLEDWPRELSISAIITDKNLEVHQGHIEDNMLLVLYSPFRVREVFFKNTYFVVYLYEQSWRSNLNIFYRITKEGQCPIQIDWL